jgi:arylsulfatase A-like enzyme
VNFQATHFPYRLPPEATAPYQPTATTRGRFNYLGYPEKDRDAAVNRYDNALHYVDEQIGGLERALDALGLLDDTIWVITADHGESFHDHGQVTHGKTLFDTEARVPLLVHWPAKLTPADVEEPVSNMDVLPTILDLLKVPPHPAFQGKSFAAPSTRSAEPPAVYMNIQGLRSAEAVVCWPWKLIVDRSARTTRLFDLERDPTEKEDRVHRDPVVAERLRATLAAQIGAQMSYHKKGNPALSERYAPRMLACPALPEVQRASATPESTGRPTRTRPAEVIPAGPAPPKTRSN